MSALQSLLTLPPRWRSEVQDGWHMPLTADDRLSVGSIGSYQTRRVAERSFKVVAALMLTAVACKAVGVMTHTEPQLHAALMIQAGRAALVKASSTLGQQSDSTCTTHARA